MDDLRDPVSSLSHFFTAGLVLAASALLVRLTTGDPVRRRCVLVYGSCATLLYTASGLYHALRLPPDQLRPFQLLDMSAIYLMIAGSATPLLVLLVPGRRRGQLLGGVWGCSAVGIVALWAFPRPDIAVMIGCYLGIALLATVGLPHFWRATGWAGMRWYAAAAGLYVGGAVVELAGWPVLLPGVVGPHELLHFADVGGTACHLVYLVGYVLPYGVAAAAQAGGVTEAAEPLRPRRAAA